VNARVSDPVKLLATGMWRPIV